MTTNWNDTAFETRAIHAGQEADESTGAVVTPIYQVSTYAQDGVGNLRNGYEYSRSANPTRTALQECLAALEDPAGAAAGTTTAMSFASGLAAEDTVLRTVLKPGDHVVVPDVRFDVEPGLSGEQLGGRGCDHQRRGYELREAQGDVAPFQGPDAAGLAPRLREHLPRIAGPT